MGENLQQIIYVTRRYPAEVVGLLLIFGAGFLSLHVQLRMVRAGYKTSSSVFWNPWTALGGYLNMRAKYDWSPWPVYLITACLILGTIVLVFGLSRP